MLGILSILNFLVVQVCYFSFESLVIIFLNYNSVSHLMQLGDYMTKEIMFCNPAKYSYKYVDCITQQIIFYLYDMKKSHSMVLTEKKIYFVRWRNFKWKGGEAAVGFVHLEDEKITM